MSFAERKTFSQDLQTKYPDRVPVIIKSSGRWSPVSLRKTNHLVPKEMTVGHFIYTLRNHLEHLGPAESIFLFTDNSLLPNSDLFINVYQHHKNEDGFLYLYYSLENTFGGAGRSKQYRPLNDTPADSKFQLLNMPPELIVQTALRLPLTELIMLCRSSPQINGILCQDDRFWKERFIYDYRPEAELHPSSWHDLYFTVGPVVYDNISRNNQKIIPLLAQSIAVGETYHLILDLEQQVHRYDHGKIIPLNIQAKRIFTGGNVWLYIDLDDRLHLIGRFTPGAPSLGRSSPINITPRIKEVSVGSSYAGVIDQDYNLYQLTNQGLINLNIKAKKVAACSDEMIIIGLNDRLARVTELMVQPIGRLTAAQLGSSDNPGETFVSVIDLKGRLWVLHGARLKPLHYNAIQAQTSWNYLYFLDPGYRLWEIEYLNLDDQEYGKPAFIADCKQFAAIDHNDEQIFYISF